MGVGGRLGAAAEAIRGGKQTYEFGGRTRSVMELRDASGYDALMKESGVSGATARSFLQSDRLNREAGSKYGIQDMARAAQAHEVADDMGNAHRDVTGRQQPGRRRGPVEGPRARADPRSRLVRTQR